MSKLDPRKAAEILQRSLIDVEAEELSARVNKDVQRDLAIYEPQSFGAQLAQGAPRSEHVPLEGYFSSALTGLSEDEQSRVEIVSQVCYDVCRSCGIDLYRPGHHTHPTKHAEISPEDVHWTDKERVSQTDLFLMFCEKGSFGAGQELEIATSSLAPVIFIYKSDTRVSRMVVGSPAVKSELSFSDLQDLAEKLHEHLIAFKPSIVARKLALTERFDLNIIGNRIRTRREELALTRKEVSEATHISVDLLKKIETSVDRVSNPSLLQLRALSYVLKVSVTELVEPDFADVMFVAMQEFAVDRAAARFQGMTNNDQIEMAKAFLVKILDGFKANESSGR